jgi:hypothetical protein
MSETDRFDVDRLWLQHDDEVSTYGGPCLKGFVVKKLRRSFSKVAISLALATTGLTATGVTLAQPASASHCQLVTFYVPGYWVAQGSSPYVTWYVWVPGYSYEGTICYV